MNVKLKRKTNKTKLKILLLSDDIRDFSGVATQSKEIIFNTVKDFNWVQLAQRPKHSEHGKKIDISRHVQDETGIKDASVILYPHNGYGNEAILKRLIDIEKPNAIIHFTDPRFWDWLYNIEYDIRQTIPIIYYNIWDNLPDPKWNLPFYLSCDLLMSISKQTYGINHRVCSTSEYHNVLDIKDTLKNNNKRNLFLSYVPHGISDKTFYKIKPNTTDWRMMKKLYFELFGANQYDFILFWSNRNIKRKRPSDVILAYKEFIKKIYIEEQQKVMLLLHTDAIDQYGTNLYEVISELAPDVNIKFTNRKYSQSELNYIYNIVDATINISSAEGFGLTTAESLMSETPILTNVTGGLQDQCGFKKSDGTYFTEQDYIELQSLSQIGNRPHGLSWSDWCIPIFSKFHTNVGSVPTPYIWEDYCTIKDTADAIYSMYTKSDKERQNMGKLGRKYLTTNNFNAISLGKNIINSVKYTIKQFKPKERIFMTSV